MANYCRFCYHEEGLHNFPHGKDDAYICLSVFPTFCGCKKFKSERIKGEIINVENRL